MPRYTVQDDFGHTLTLEGDSPPTEQELEDIFSSFGEPEGTASIPAGLTDEQSEAISKELSERSQMEQQLREYTGGSFMSPGGPDLELARAIYGPGGAVRQGASAVGEAVHAVMQPLEKVGSTILQPLRGIAAPVMMALGADPMTAFSTPVAEPGKTVVPGLEPEAGDVGVIPSIRRAAAGITTPGGILAAPLAIGPGAAGKAVTGMFAAGAGSAIPGGIDAFVEAETPAEMRGAATDVALSAGFAGLMGRNLSRGGQRAIQQETTRAVPDVQQRQVAPEGAGQVPVRESRPQASEALTRDEAEAQGPNAVRAIMEKHGVDRDTAVTMQAEARQRLGISKEVPATRTPSRSVLEELTELQAARDEGMLSDRDAIRLAQLEVRHGVRGLSTEDAMYVIQEREGMRGVELGGKQVGIEVVDTVSTETPFSPASKISPFTINPKTGNVVIIADRMRTYRSSLRQLGFSEAQINQALKSSINEEVIHLGTNEAVALEYWNRLSGFERAVNRRRYGLGEEPGPQMTPTLMGMEALRFRIQQASKMTPTEFTQMALSERWTWQAITALEKAVRFAREKFTSLGKEQKRLFDITLANLASAKSAVASVTPSAPMRKIVEVEREDGTRYQAEFNGYWDMRPFGGDIRPSVGRGDVRAGETLSHGMLGPKEKIVTEIPSFEEWKAATSEKTTPSAPRRKGPMSRRGEEMARLQGLRAQMAEGGAEPAGEAASRLMQEAYEPVTPVRAAQEAERFVLESKKPSFEGFAESFRVKFGAIPSGQLRELFAENVGEALIRAPGERIAEMVKEMGLTKHVIGGGKPGERRLGTIPDPMGIPAKEPVLRQALLGFTGEQTGLEISAALQRAIRRKGAPVSRASSSSQRLRMKAIGAIFNRLINESEGIGKPTSRTEILPEEIGSHVNAKAPVFGDIRSSELVDIPRLGQLLTTDARSFNRPVSATKRLVTLLNKRTGEVDMVDVYMDPRRGAVAMSPVGASAHQSLESVMKTHRPIHSILLDEPVQNFRKRYKSLAEFNREFGAEARERARASEYQEFAGEPSVESELEPGTAETSGTLSRPEFRTSRGVLETEAPLTDAEARATLEYIRSEVGEITSPEDVALAVESFKQVADFPIRHRNTQAISGIIKMLRSAMEQSERDMTPGQALEQVARFIYETQRRTENADQFARIALGNYRGRIAEAGGPSEPAPSRTARELVAPAPGERISPGIEGVTPPQVARPRIEGVGGGLRETMARGAEAREAAREAGAPARAEQIRAEAQGETYESAFERNLIETTRIQKEIEAEVARETPRLERETTEQWLERVRENAERMSEYKAAQDQANLDKTITPSASMRHALPLGKKLADLVVAPVVAGLRVGSEWMVDRIQRVAAPTAKVTQQQMLQANQIIKNQQSYSGDMFARFGDDILRQSGKLNRATRWMNELQVVAPGKGAIVNSVEAIEGRLRPPDYARALNEQAQEANVLIGEFMEPVAPGFIANGGMSRNLNAFGYDIIRDGSGPDFNRLVDATVAANKGMSPREVKLIFKKMKRVLDDPDADSAALFKMNQDFVRQIPRAITHIWTGSKRFGHWEPVLQSELFNYFNHGIRKAAMMRAFREFYPVGGKDYRAAIRTMRAELPAQWHPLVNSLYRTLQGHPSENISQTGFLNVPGAITQPGGALIRTLSPLGQTMKSMWLSQQIFLQPGELMSGASEIFFGYQKSALATLRHKEMYPMLESSGAVDRILYNNAWNPNSPIRSAFRVFNNNVRRATGQNLWNELQEAQAAGAAYLNAERLMQAARDPSMELTWSERNLLPQTFRVMGFNPEQVKAMMAGDPVLLGQMVNKAASFSSGGHMHPSQQSRLTANRAFQGLFWFQRYPMTRLNQFMKLSEVLFSEARAGRTKEARNTAILMAKFMAGATQQGLLQTAILTAVYGGPFALMLKFHEAEDEPFAFMFDMWRSAMGGPFQLATRGWEDAGIEGVANNFKRLAAPVNIAGEVWDVANGAGAYSDLDLTTRIGKYLGRSIPLSKTVKFGMASFGLSQDDPALDDSIKALNKWKRSKFGFEESKDFWKEDSKKAFRIQMKKAVEAIKNGDVDGHLEAVLAAAGEVEEGKDPLEAVKASFNARRVLRNPKTGADLTLEETEELIERIGEDAYERLVALDLMLRHASGQGD